MADIKIRNLGGSPKKEIDKKTFEGLCAIQCTKVEMCGIFDIDEKTLTRWCKDTYGIGFSDIFKRKSAAGKISLRRTQFEMAKKNVVMAIFLGKQYLEQSDKQETKSEVAIKPDGFIAALKKESRDVWDDEKDDETELLE